MQTIMCGALPPQDQHNFGHPAITIGIRRAKLEVSVDPCSDLPPEISPPNAIMIVGREKLRTALVDQGKQLFVDDTVAVMELAEGTSVTCRSFAIGCRTRVRLTPIGFVQCAALETFDARHFGILRYDPSGLGHSPKQSLQVARTLKIPIMSCAKLRS
jgi:hypothetical protein